MKFQLWAPDGPEVEPADVPGYNWTFLGPPTELDWADYKVTKMKVMNEAEVWLPLEIKEPKLRLWTPYGPTALACGDWWCKPLEWVEESCWPRQHGIMELPQEVDE